MRRYMEEVAQSLMEAKVKMSDMAFVVDLCSHCHRLYAEFTPMLLELFKKSLPRRATDTISNMSKLRTDLRWFADLIVAGKYCSGCL